MLDNFAKKSNNFFTDTNPFTQDFDDLMEAIVPTEFENALCQMVYNCYTEARDFKKSCGIEDCLERDLRAKRGVYNPDELARFKDTNAIYHPITQVKIRASEAWANDIYSQTEETLFTMEATPIPELMPELEEVVLDSLEQELIQSGAEGENVDQLALENRDLAIDHQHRLAALNTENHRRLIQDQLEEGNFRHVFRDFRSDLMTYKSAIIKGPIVRPVYKKSYDLNGKAITVRKMIPMYERICPFDFFPSPDATGTQPDESAYIIHRRRVCKADVWKLSQMQGVSIAAINKVFSENPEGHYSCEQHDSDFSLGNIQRTTANYYKTPFYELINYYGKIPGRFLLDHANITGISPNFDYEAHVIISGGMVIRAMLNPYSVNMRPFHSTSFMKNSDGFWGTSLPQILRPVQRKANGAVRAMVKNLAYSSGFIAEANVDKMKDEEDVENMTPYRTYLTSGRTNTTPALRVHQIQSTAPQLISLMQRFEREADDLSGIPPYVLGQAGNAAPPRTTGVLALLLGAAARGMKFIIANTDKDVIEPMITMHYHVNMCNTNGHFHHGRCVYQGPRRVWHCRARP